LALRQLLQRILLWRVVVRGATPQSPLTAAQAVVVRADY
jgi:hypothetical protein